MVKDLEDISFVYIIHDITFWSILSLEKIILSMNLAGYSTGKVYAIFNKTRPEQRQYFIDYFSNSNWEIIPVLPFENFVKPNCDISEDIENCYYDGRHKILLTHGSILCWLLKYYLQDGKYLFIDHDCVVNDCFIEKLKDRSNEIDDKFWVVPYHPPDSSSSSITAPMFLIDLRIVRKMLSDIPDFLFLTFGNYEKFSYNISGTDEENYFLSKNYANDTMKLVFRRLMNIGGTAFFDWGYNEHCWAGFFSRIDNHTVVLMRQYFIPRMKPEIFESDLIYASETMEKFISNLDKLKVKGLNE